MANLIEGKFTCTICRKFFNSPEEFRVHSISLCLPIETFNDTTLSYAILLNSDDVSSENELKEEEIKYEVEPPRKIFHTVGYASSHSKTKCDELPKKSPHHAPQIKSLIKFPNLTCTVCKKNCETKTLLVKHMREHACYKDSYLCTHCGKVFFHFASFRSHERSHSELLCKLCGRNDFKSFYHYDQHMKMHNSKRTYRCDECGKSYKTSFVYRQHRSSHYDKRPFLCEYCGEQVTGLIFLRRHIQRHKASCRHCGKWCGSKEKLRHHRCWNPHAKRKTIESKCEKVNKPVKSKVLVKRRKNGKRRAI